MLDPNWQNGRYLESNEKPENGLSVARMIAHITYLSEKAFQNKFGRNLQEKNDLSFGFGIDFQVESYLRYHDNEDNFRPESLFQSQKINHFFLVNFDQIYFEKLSQISK